jgi:Flp pilus assembly pilin Flp
MEVRVLSPAGIHPARMYADVTYAPTHFFVGTPRLLAQVSELNVMTADRPPAQDHPMVPSWRRQVRLDDELGQALVEYALIMALIVIVVLTVLIVMGNTVANLYCNIAGAVVR